MSTPYIRAMTLREIMEAEDGPSQEFRDFQRIRLKHINEMLNQLNQDATGIHLLMAEKKAIEEFLGVTTA